MLKEALEKMLTGKFDEVSPEEFREFFNHRIKETLIEGGGRNAVYEKATWDLLNNRLIKGDVNKYIDMIIDVYWRYIKRVTTLWETAQLWHKCFTNPFGKNSDLRKKERALMNNLRTNEYVITQFIRIIKKESWPPIMPDGRPYPYLPDPFRLEHQGKTKEETIRELASLVK